MSKIVARCPVFVAKYLLFMLFIKTLVCGIPRIFIITKAQSI